MACDATVDQMSAMEMYRREHAGNGGAGHQCWNGGAGSIRYSHPVTMSVATMQQNSARF